MRVRLAVGTASPFLVDVPMRPFLLASTPPKAEDEAGRGQPIPVNDRPPDQVAAKAAKAGGKVGGGASTATPGGTTRERVEVGVVAPALLTDGRRRGSDKQSESDLAGK